MIRTTQDAVEAYEKRTGFEGIGSFLMRRGVLLLEQDHTSSDRVYNYKSFSEMSPHEAV